MDNLENTERAIIMDNLEITERAIIMDNLEKLTIYGTQDEDNKR